MRTLNKTLLATTTSLVIAAAIWAAIPTATHPKPLAADLPPGPLLTLETPDFAALLHTWNASSEQAAWLKSANYSAFANSHLFGRLADAQAEFEGAAGAKHGFDSAFLQQIAGKESIFAWYDISKLEFLYISHLPPGKTANVDLLQQRGKFSRRESGGTSFYIRTSTASPNDTADADTNAGPATPRTVVFATRGDWIILASREDLIANTLLLMQSTDVHAPSAATEGWYAAAEAAGPPHHGDLHMLLDLQRITATAAFQTHWIQRNVTATRQYRAATVDLYRDAATFREERVLLPNAPTDTAPQPDLAALESLVPDRASVYRASASPQPADALATLDEKLLTRSTTSAVHNPDAPDADLSIPQPGNATDLETRIDTISPTPEPATAATTPLLHTLQSAGLTSMLTLDRTEPARTDASATLFVPIHSAVILRASNPWNAAQLQSALLTALRSHLTVSTLGLIWTPAAGNFFTLGATNPLNLFVDGNTAILTNDPTLMTDILSRRSTTTPPQPATLIAAFHHTQERPAFHRLANSLATTAHTTGPNAKDQPPIDATTPGETPDFFAASVGSLSDAFHSLATERLLERRDGPLTRQTVTYTWQTK